MSKLKTLVTDPFEDDAATMLEWLYGRAARVGFERFRILASQRVGQAFMNTLYAFDPIEYRRIAQSSVDPFYLDKNLPAALDLLTSK